MILTSVSRRPSSLERFHLGNGARLEAIHTEGDLSAKGMREAHGVMVNYLYDLAAIEANHIRLFELGEVAVSAGVQMWSVSGLEHDAIR